MKEITFKGYPINRQVFIMENNEIKKRRVEGIELHCAAGTKVKFYLLTNQEKGNSAHYPENVFGSKEELVESLLKES
jgi:hypothetical protein